MKHKYLGVLILTLLSLTISAEKTIKVACIGNSITYGIGVEHPETESYPAQLQQLLGSAYKVGRFGKPGATLLFKAYRPYTQQKEFQEALAFAGDIAVIHLGVNDTDPRAWPNYGDNFIRDYLALIDSFKTVNPKCKFFIALTSPLSHRHHRFESGTRDWQDEIQQCIHTIANLSGAQLIDFHTPLYNHPHLIPDGIHPNKEGAALMAQTVYSAITGDYGGLKLSPMFTNNMVLQRNKPLTITGTANAGSKVRLQIANQTHKATASAQGKWTITINPLKAGGPYTLTIQAGKQKLTFNNVLIGEVWLCSGQSNMEFKLQQAITGARDIPSEPIPNIRLYNMEARWRTNAVEWPTTALDSINQLAYTTTPGWTECTPEQAAQFSAVAYYFGKMLSDSLNVPIGLICNAVGGSPTESWIDRSTLEHQFPAILRNWRSNDFIQDWVRGRASLNIKQASTPLQRHPYEPCYLYENSIAPLKAFPIAGVIWYQGESNAHNIEAHERLFPLLIDSWRHTWNNTYLPFYYVQLSSLNRPSWPKFRDSQRRLLASRPALGMAICSDIGDSLDVHPRRKLEVGQRLARVALHQTYHHDLCPTGPLFEHVMFNGNTALVTFKHANNLHTSDGKPIRTFEVAAHKGLFYPAQAKITTQGILLTSPYVKKPRYVRYGWQPFTRANLVNGDGLPASTFQSE